MSAQVRAPDMIVSNLLATVNPLDATCCLVLRKSGRANN